VVGWRGRTVLVTGTTTVLLPDLAPHPTDGLSTIATTVSDDGRTIAGQSDDATGAIQAVVWHCQCTTVRPPPGWGRRRSETRTDPMTSRPATRRACAGVRTRQVAQPTRIRRHDDLGTAVAIPMYARASAEQGLGQRAARMEANVFPVLDTNQKS
jgi:hypothetical protein